MIPALVSGSVESPAAPESPRRVFPEPIIFDTYWHLIYGLAMKCGLTDAEAQDAVQETRLSAAKQMPELNDDPALGPLKGWLLLITRRREGLNRPPWCLPA